MSNEWLNDLKEGDMVGLRYTTSTVTMYKLAKVEKITPTGIIRLVTLPSPVGGGYSKLSFRMNNTQIRDKSSSFSSTSINMVSYDVANIHISQDLLTKRKKELASNIATILYKSYNQLPLEALELIELELKRRFS